MKQLLLTTSAGKRLIATALAVHPEIKKILVKGTIVIVAGTTNGYVAEEILTAVGEKSSFNKSHFFRGLTLPPNYEVNKSGRVSDESGFPGDVVIRNGEWLKGKTITDVTADLKEGDIVLKGANALDLAHKRAAVLIGNLSGGTIIPILQALIGRRVRLILPVGLEKRVPGNLDELANKTNAPGVKGWRLLPVPGEVFTEIDALEQLSGAKCEIFAAGGVCGAEGSVWLSVNGAPDREETAEKIVKSITREPSFGLD